MITKRPLVEYKGESESELLKKLCEINPTTGNCMSNIRLSQPLGTIVVAKTYKDSWLAVNNVYRGWSVIVKRV